MAAAARGGAGCSRHAGRNGRSLEAQCQQCLPCPHLGQRLLEHLGLRLSRHRLCLRHKQLPRARRLALRQRRQRARARHPGAARRTAAGAGAAAAGRAGGAAGGAGVRGLGGAAGGSAGGSDGSCDEVIRQRRGGTGTTQIAVRDVDTGGARPQHAAALPRRRRGPAGRQAAAAPLQGARVCPRRGAATPGRQRTPHLRWRLPWEVERDVRAGCKSAPGRGFPRLLCRSKRAARRRRSRRCCRCGNVPAPLCLICSSCRLQLAAVWGQRCQPVLLEVLRNSKGDGGTALSRRRRRGRHASTGLPAGNRRRCGRVLLLAVRLRACGALVGTPRLDGQPPVQRRQLLVLLQCGTQAGLPAQCERLGLAKGADACASLFYCCCLIQGCCCSWIGSRLPAS